MSDDLGMHSRYLKQQMRTIWRLPNLICTGFDILIESTTSWRCWSTDASMDWRRATSPTNSRACRRLCRDGTFGWLRRPILLCLAFSGRHSAAVHSLWQQLKHGTAYHHMSHHLHRWRLSNAAQGHLSPPGSWRHPPWVMEKSPLSEIFTSPSLKQIPPAQKWRHLPPSPPWLDAPDAASRLSCS